MSDYGRWREAQDAAFDRWWNADMAQRTEFIEVDYQRHSEGLKRFPIDSDAKRTIARIAARNAWHKALESQEPEGS